MRTDFDFRRTVTTLTFCAAGLPLVLLLAAGARALRSDATLLYKLMVGVEVLLGIVLIGLSFTVAMRQIHMKGFGADFSASGGDASPAVTITTETKVAPNHNASEPGP